MKTITILVAVVLLATAGCDRQIDSKSPTTPVPATGQVPTSLIAKVNNGTISLSWEIADPTEVVRYRVYAAESVPVDFILRDSTDQTTITLENLLINRTYYFRVAALMSHGVEWTYSEIVTASTGYLSILIAGGDEYVNSQSVTIQINATSLATHVILSEDPEFTDAVYQSFSPVRSFTLSEGDGEKTVYARIQFVDGSTSGELLSDDVILDTEVAIDSVWFQPAGPFAAGNVITFMLESPETGGEARVSFEGESSLDLADDGVDGDAVADDGIYTLRYEVPPNLAVDNVTVTGAFTDVAGNFVTATAANLLTIITPAADASDEPAAIHHR